MRSEQQGLAFLADSHQRLWRWAGGSRHSGLLSTLALLAAAGLNSAPGSRIAQATDQRLKLATNRNFGDRGSRGLASRAGGASEHPPLTSDTALFYPGEILRMIGCRLQVSPANVSGHCPLVHAYPALARPPHGVDRLSPGQYARLSGRTGLDHSFCPKVVFRSNHE